MEMDFNGESEIAKERNIDPKEKEEESKLEPSDSEEHDSRQDGAQIPGQNFKNNEITKVRRENENGLETASNEETVQGEREKELQLVLNDSETNNSSRDRNPIESSNNNNEIFEVRRRNEKGKEMAYNVGADQEESEDGSKQSGSESHDSRKDLSGRYKNENADDKKEPEHTKDSESNVEMSDSEADGSNSEQDVHSSPVQSILSPISSTINESDHDRVSNERKNETRSRSNSTNSSCSSIFTKNKISSKSSRDTSPDSSGSSSDEMENVTIEIEKATPSSALKHLLSSEDEESDNDKHPFDRSNNGEDNELIPDQDDEDGNQGRSSKLDFDLMMERKKEERSRPRKRKDIAMINDNDDAIAKLIADMRQAAREDRELNKQGMPATRKMAMFHEVKHSLGKVDLQLAFVEANILSTITDWLSPLPKNKALPHLLIRSEFLRYLKDLPLDDHSRLKESGVGKAVMYLYRHPKETRANKDIAGKIIYQWARPIFNVCTDYSTMTKFDRQKRDEEMAAKLNRKRSKTVKEDESGSSEKSLRPGDPGWVGRARVPMPDIREFVTRPRWQSEIDMSHFKDNKKEVDKLEKYKRKFQDKKRLIKNHHAVKLSLEGRKLDL